MITGVFADPFYEGGTVTALVPSVWPVAINGRTYMLDTLPESMDLRWNVETIPLLRQQADQSKSPAEASLNPASYWRRAGDSFHYGAGQIYRDRDIDTDDPRVKYRYRASKGIDPWVRWEMSLLHDTELVLDTTESNVQAVVAGDRLYASDGSNLRYTEDLISWSDVGSYSGGDILSIASDGFNVYATDGANIWTTNTGTTTASSADTTNVDLVGYVKGRFMAAKDNILYNIPTLGSGTAVLTFTHGNTAFQWTGFAEGPSHIYASGFAGDKSLIYRIEIQTDGTALSAPVVAVEVPDGEIVRAIQGYLGFLIVGTDLGFRLADIDISTGNLTLGPLVETTSPVTAFEPQGRFVWYALTNYDDDSTGLGRMDLSVFTSVPVPAYASDLMVDGDGIVTSIATFNEQQVFTVEGLGVYAESDELVEEGTMDTGLIGFGLPDPKLAVYVHADTAPLVGSYRMYLADATGTFTLVGVESDQASTTNNFPADNVMSERFEVRVVLERATTTTGPTFVRWTLKVIPTTSDGPAELFHIPLMLYPIVRMHGNEYPVDVEFERAFISDLRATKQIVTYQQFHTTYTGIIVDFKEVPYGLAEDAETGEWSLKSTLLVDFQRLN